MRTGIEVAFVVVFTVVWPTYEFIRLSGTRARMAGAAPGRRAGFYAQTMVEQWLLAAAALALTLGHGRPLATLGLAAPVGLGIVWSVAFLALIGWLVRAQHTTVMRSRRGRESARRQLAAFAWLMPRDGRELAGFRALSVTAGVCEEILFRGYLQWFLTPFMGLPAALLLGAVAFGLAHAYQGKTGVVKTGILGLVMALIYRLTGSLLAPILIHALVDWTSGQLAYSLERHVEEPERAE